MAFKLALSNFNSGVESQAAQVLTCLKYFATLTPPVTVANIRTDLETSQFQAFSNDGWDNFIQAVATIELDNSALTVAERAIFNTLIEYISPPPKTGCCEIGGDVKPSLGDGLTTFNDYYRTGSTLPYQYEFEAILDKTYTCDIETLEVTFTPTGGAPNVTSASPTVMTSNGCNSNSDRILFNVWVELDGDPSGESYNLSLVWKDGNGTIIDSYSPAAAHIFT
jgi:hypothetical protein